MSGLYEHIVVTGVAEVKSVSTIAPPPNHGLHERENEEYLPLQAAKLKKKKRNRLEFTIGYTLTGGNSKIKKKEGEKARNRF